MITTGLINLLLSIGVVAAFVAVTLVPRVLARPVEHMTLEQPREAESERLAA